MGEFDQFDDNQRNQDLEVTIRWVAPRRNVVEGLFLKRKRRPARWAATIRLMALQYKCLAVFNAVGTQITHGSLPFLALFQAIHDRTGWRFPELVVHHIGLKTLLFAEFIQRSRKLSLKIRIRQLRICYLHSELAQSQFNLGIATRIRFLEKLLYGYNTIDERNCGASELPRRFQSAFNHLEIQSHNLLQIQSDFREHIAKLRSAK